MDILNPELVWIDNRCYRKLPIRETTSIKCEENSSATSKICDEEEDDDDDLPIKKEGDQFEIKIGVPSELMGFVIGKESRTVKTLEQTTGAKIRYPRRNRNADVANDFVITSKYRRSVISVYRRIESIISTARLKINSTHFISFPINSQEIQESFLKFKNDVLSNFKNIRGIDESIFQKPEKLHLTVAMLILLDRREKEKASLIFQKCKNEILNKLIGKKLDIEVKGIEYMNDDPAEVDVLYAKVQEVDGDNCLQIIADLLYKEFLEAGFCKKEFDDVKLHITLMNSLFRSDEGSNNRNVREAFDVTPLLEKYLNYYFGQMTLSEIHISIRYTQRDDGYYLPSCVMKLS